MRATSVRLVCFVAFIAAVFVCAAGLARAQAQQQASISSESRDGVELYAATGSELTQYHVDVDHATLAKGPSIGVPGAIQYAWPHPSRKYLYVAWSNPRSGAFGISTVQIERGALKLVGEPAPIPARPIHVTVDIPGTHVLVAYNSPSMLTVHPIRADGSVGEPIQQAAGLNFGVYAHQVRVDPSNKTVVLVTRGNGPEGDKPEDPGALRIFVYDHGVLSPLSTVAPDGGRNYQPRHLDFHPAGPWVYVSLERQSLLHLYERKADGSLGSHPLFVKDSLENPAERAGQLAGAIHVHPNGRFVYQANRATNTKEMDGKRVFSGGENSIAVYSIDPKTGEPTRIQSADTRGFSPRTFTLDPSGRILVAANQSPLLASGKAGLQLIPASLAIFRIRRDGMLDYVSKTDVETGNGGSLIWAGIVALP